MSAVVFDVCTEGSSVAEEMGFFQRRSGFYRRWKVYFPRVDRVDARISIRICPAP
ncbi:MAG: hypothetical protein HW374_2185, partial [Bacteroidetes bacterium]|nr:hypothetical protein [Bacteroidota bacterium]